MKTQQLLEADRFMKHDNENRVGAVELYFRVARTSNSLPTIAIQPMDTGDISTAEKFKLYSFKNQKAKKKFQELSSKKRYEGTELSENEEIIYELLNDIGNGDIWKKDQNDRLSKNISYIKEFVEVNNFSSFGELYKFLTTKTSLVSTGISDIFKRDFEQEDVEQNADLRVNGFNVFFPPNMQKKRKENFVQVLDKTYELLKKSGAEFVTQGTELRFKKISGIAVGLYYFKADDLIIDPSSDKAFSKEKGLTKTLVHELGHRMDYKFSIPKIGEEIQEKYTEVSKNINNARKEEAKADDFGVQVGTSLSYTGKDKETLQFSPYVVDSIEDDNKLIKISSQRLPMVKFKISASGICKQSQDWHIQGREIDCDWFDIKMKDTDNWFPSQYSTTNRAEWFAELFMFYIFGKLSGGPKVWMESVIKRSK